MLYKYKSVDEKGGVNEATIEAVSMDVAISSLQRRGLVVSSIFPAEEAGGIFSKAILGFGKVKTSEIVILSRQMATLFEAQVSALRIFRLLSEMVTSPALKKTLEEVSNDLQSGSSITKALTKHPKVFSEFYVNMVLSGEESGKLDQIFMYLADYLDSSYAVTLKVRNALIYPAFVVATFITVMVLMLTAVIPKISQILTEAGQDIPIYTKIVIGLSNFLVNFGPFILIFLVVGVFFLFKFKRTDAGKIAFDRFKISIPYVGDLYRKLYFSRIADNMNTMIISGISMVRAIKITSAVVDNKIYENILNLAVDQVKGGKPLSESLSQSVEIPGIMTQMIKIGEETGELGSILKILSKFYQREVTTAVDTVVGLIEPALIVGLGLGVGFLMASVLIPIYNISSAM